jgi:hypothetical protein
VVDNFLKENLVLFRLQARDEAPWAPQVFGMLYSDKGHNFYLLKVGGTTLAYDTGEGEWSIFSSFITGANSALTDFHPSFVSRDYTIGDDAIAGLVNGTSNVEYSGPIQGLVRTANMDFGNAWKKYIQKISFWGEQVQDSFSVRYTNDDYQTYSNSMAVDMSKIRMMINRQGSCYRRAYEFTYNGTLSWRMRMFEFQIRGGSN